MRVGLSEGSSFAASQMFTYQSLSSSSRSVAETIQCPLCMYEQCMFG